MQGDCQVITKLVQPVDTPPSHAIPDPANSHKNGSPT
jgi:hypothetical protein